MTSISDSRPQPLRYSAASKWLHWIIAATVIVLIPEGLTMKRLLPEGDLRDTVYTLHEAAGAAVLLIMVARAAIRWRFGAPRPLEILTPFERIASASAQALLYALLFIVPVLGWAATNAYGEAVSVFGLFNFPTLLGKNLTLSDQIFVWHLAGGLLIAAIASLHIAGALYHRFVKHDEVLARMLPQD
jgi:cytochrome b561